MGTFGTSRREMPPMPLTDAALRKTKPTDKVQRLFDGGGLYLEISRSGGKLWRQKYRFGGKEKRLAHGIYPDVSLAEARERRDAARKLLAADIDPAEHRKATKAASEERATNSFEAVAREWPANDLSAPPWSSGGTIEAYGRTGPRLAARRVSRYRHIATGWDDRRTP